MYKIGITGSIGTGKTSIANIFALFNIPVFDADKEIKKILSKTKVREEIKNIWPIVVENDLINKLKLKSIIFSRKREKKKLEKLLYPYLETEKKNFEGKNYLKKILVYDVPLIYETKSQNNYNLILLANCKPDIQKKRVLKRDKISSSLYEKILRSQLSFDEKKKFKPKIINTNDLKFIIYVRVVLQLIKILINLQIKKWKKIEN